MPQTTKNSALDLALALKRYNRMKPENAYVALAKEWPQPIVAIVHDLLWSEVKLKGRTIKDITRETSDLLRKVISNRKAASQAVEAVKRKQGLLSRSKRNAR